MRRVFGTALIAVLGVLVLFSVSGCRPDVDSADGELVLVFNIDDESGVLSQEKVTVPGGEDPLEYALLQSDPGILLSHSQGEDGQVTLYLDPDWEAESDREEILSVYSLVNAAAAAGGAVDVRVARGEHAEEFCYDGAHLVADWSLQRPGWDEECVSAEELDIQPLDQVPAHFSPAGWIDERRILGITGGRLAVHDVDSETTDRLEIDVWSVLPSPDGRKIAFVDQEGVKYARLDEPESAELLSDDREDEGIWMLTSFSPDSTQLLFSRVHEWDATYYVYHLRTGQIRQLQTGLQGYFLTHGGTWLGNDAVIFNVRAVARKNGAAEYGFGMRGDLTLYCLSDDSYELITDVQDGRFVMAEGRAGTEQITFRENSPGERPVAGIYRPNSTEKTMFSEPAAGIVPDPTGERFAVLSERVPMRRRSHVHLWIYEQDALSGDLRLRNIDAAPQVHWAPGGDRFTLTATFIRDLGEIRRTFLVNLCR